MDRKRNKKKSSNFHVETTSKHPPRSKNERDNFQTFFSVMSFCPLNFFCSTFRQQQQIFRFPWFVSARTTTEYINQYPVSITIGVSIRANQGNCPKTKIHFHFILCRELLSLGIRIAFFFPMVDNRFCVCERRYFIKKKKEKRRVAYDGDGGALFSLFIWISCGMILLFDFWSNGNELFYYWLSTDWMYQTKYDYVCLWVDVWMNVCGTRWISHFDKRNERT